MFGNSLGRVERCIKKQDVQALLNLSGAKTQEVCVAAIRGLGRCAGDEAYNALIPFLRDSKPANRAAAAYALGHLKRPAAIPHLQHQVEMEKDPHAEAAMREAISKLQTKD